MENLIFIQQVRRDFCRDIGWDFADVSLSRSRLNVASIALNYCLLLQLEIIKIFLIYFHDQIPVY
jgi:hypothetical protein